MGYYNGFGVSMESLDSYVDTRRYQTTLNFAEVYIPLKNEAKEIFGEGIIYEIDGSYTSAMHKNIIDRLGTDMARNKKTGLRKIILSAFVEDLDKEMENIDYWKEGMYQLGKKYWEYYNVTGALQLYLYDKEMLYRTDIVKASLTKADREDEEIVRIIEKLEKFEELNQGEKDYIVSKFSSGSLYINNYKEILAIFFSTNRIERKNELNIENIEIDFVKEEKE